MLAPSDASRTYDVKKVGSDGCSPHRMLLGNPTVPGWQRWMLAPSGASRKPDLTRLAAMDARPIGCF